MATETTLQLLIATGKKLKESFVVADLHQKDTPLVFINTAFSELTGYHEVEILGRNCRFLQGIETNIESIKQIKKQIQLRQTLHHDILNYKKDGSTFWNRLFLFPAGEDQSDPDYCVGIQHEVPRPALSSPMAIIQGHIQNPFFQIASATKAHELIALTENNSYHLDTLSQLIQEQITTISNFLRTLGK